MSYISGVNPPQAQWSEDFSSGSLPGQWDGLNHSGSAPDPTLQTAIVETGPYAMQAGPCSVSNYRSEAHLGGNNRALYAYQGQTIFYGWSIYVPSAMKDNQTWQVCGQWHQPTDSGDGWDTASPSIAVYICSNQQGEDGLGITIGGGTNNPNNYPWWGKTVLTPTPKDKWTHLVFKIQWGTTTLGTAAVSAWANGVQTVNNYIPPATPLIYPVSSGSRYNYFKLGLYRDANITGNCSVYFDKVQIASTFAGADTRP